MFDPQCDMQIVDEVVKTLNDRILPSNNKNNDLLEERRLCYVGITRAKEFLYLSSSEYHIINGMRKRLQPSLFINEIK